jgi:membrane protein YqaA with SNARE-associated domain
MDLKTRTESEITIDDRTPDMHEGRKGRFTPVLITAAIIISGIIVTGIYRQQISNFGAAVMRDYGQNYVDLVLFGLTAVSCTPLMLPVWGYALVGVALGYGMIRLAVVMAFGAALGSLVTFALGRFFRRHNWVKKRFPQLTNHPWSQGKSRFHVSWILFLGTASPIPCDVFYAACGAKRYPVVLFLAMMVSGRFVRYVYLGFGFKYITGIF